MNEIVEAEEKNELMIVETGQAVALARVEIDMQISTARAYPRSPSLVQKAILEMVMLDKESAEECMYAVPVDGKPVTGPSIRFAEAVKQAWGNCSAGARVTDVSRADRYVEAEGVFLDLQTNTRTTFKTRRSISGKNGKVYSDRMITTTGNAACSIAMREAILKGVPRPVWRAAYQAVLQTIKGDIKTLGERRQRAVAAFAIYGVSAERVFERLEVSGIEDVGLDDLPELFAMFQSIKSGEGTVEDYFGKGKTATGHDVVKNPLADDEERISSNKSENESSAGDGSSNGATSGHPSGQAAGHQPATGEDSPETIQSTKSAVSPALNGQSAKEEPKSDLLAGSADDGFPGDTPMRSDRPLYKAALENAKKGRRHFDAWHARLRPEQKDDLKPELADLMKMAKQQAEPHP